MNHSLSQSQAQVLRTALAESVHRLRFEPQLEQEFVQQLMRQHRQSLLFTLFFAWAVWCFFAGFDWWRMRLVAGSDKEWSFLWGVVLQRWIVMVLFVVSLFALVLRQPSTRLQEWGVTGTLIISGMGMLVSSYTLLNIGLPHASYAMVLVLVIAFAPLGIRFRYALTAGVAICALSTAAGPLMLEGELLNSHWLLVTVMWIALVFSAVTTYLREQAMRQQFVLRRLLEWETGHDALTGLANRTMFLAHFQRCLLHAQRMETSLYLAILDIDHFKLYNDYYGQQHGDQVIHTVAQLLSSYTRRPLDMAVRLGGEEFALVLYEDDAALVLQRMQELLLSLEALGIVHAPSPTGKHITASMGLARAEAQDSLDSLFKKADDGLRQAKAQGRNQVSVRTSVSEPAPAVTIE